MMTNFDDRKAKAQELLIEFLGEFTPPRGLGDDIQARRISSTADAFARRMSIHGDFEEKVRVVFQSVRDTYASNTWPSQAIFVGLMPKWETIGKDAPKSFRPDDMVGHYREKVGRGEALPEAVIWGRLASSIGLEGLRQYHENSVSSWQKIYKERAEEMMRKRYGYSVDEFMHRAGFVGGAHVAAPKGGDA